MPKAQAARTFGVGISTVKRYATKARRGESLEPGKAPGKPPKMGQPVSKLLEEDLRACLVSKRVGLGGAESAPFTRRTALRGPSLRGGFFGFRSVSSKESLQRGPPRRPENAK
jgi:hypothetical protein